MSSKRNEIYVDEEVKIGIQLAIKRFMEDESQTELEFPSSFTSTERAFLHRKCNQNGLVSKSYGKGTSRYLMVRKKRTNEVLESPMIFKFGQNSKQVLQALLHKWPMKNKEKSEIQPKVDHQQFQPNVGYRTDLNKPSGRLPNGIPQVPMKRSPSELDAFRKTLPVFHMKDQIITTIWENSVVLIAGETGSGKTTQIPQFILDESLRRNEVCRIVCTQPRRISAVAMANRVAIERGETVGQTVGYQIRLESRASPRTLLTFCTNGVLLRTLMCGDDVTQTMTHVIIDEVHERDRFSDFLLIKLRQLVQAKKLFRLVLMSASLETELFVKYFNQCPVVSIPGKMFDVATLYLEDVLECTGYLCDKLDHLKTKQEKSKAQEKTLKKWRQDGSGDSPKKSVAAKEDASSLDSEVTKLTLCVIVYGSFGQKFINSYHCWPTSIVNIPSSKEVSPVEQWIVRDMDDAIFRAWRQDDTSAYDQIYHLVASESAPVDHRHTDAGITPLMVAAARGRMEHVERLLAFGSLPGLLAPNNMSSIDFALHGGHSEVAELLTVQTANPVVQEEPADEKSSKECKELVSLYHQSFDDDNIDYDLIMCILEMLCTGTDEGAILIFLPGYDDIVAMRDLVVGSDELSSSSDIRLFTLHSSMQTSGGQTQVFQPVPKGTRKIILSTNIAESAITVDDVVYVIDSGKVKIKMYESITSTSSLKSVWIAQSSAIQRRGRAGRCRPGTCFHLFSSSRYASMPMYQVPELLRMPMHELCLHVKLLDTTGGSGRFDPAETGSIENFLSYAPSPPSSIVVKNAVKLLKTIDALDPYENLTDLGQHMVDLPIEPRLAKMVLHGVVLKCLDPILTIACTLAYKDPFQLPQDPRMRKQALECRVKLAAGTFSDHMCLLRVFQSWQKAKSDGWEPAFCRKNFLSQATMEMIVGMRSQLLGQLRATGFVRARGGNDIRDLNTNSENWAVVKAAICASMYPNILRYDKKFRTLCSANLKKVKFHNSSVLGDVTLKKEGRALPSSWVVFDEMTRSSTRFNSISSARCCTAVTPACVAVFAGPAFIAEAEAIANPEAGSGPSPGYPPESDSETEDHDLVRMSTLNVTGWIKLQMDPMLAQMLYQLRTKWHSLFARRIRNSSKAWQPEDEAILSTVINILSCEDQAIGLTQPSGIGQRPRPLSQDDGAKTSRFIQRTPDSGRRSNDHGTPEGRKQPKSLNFSRGNYQSRGSSPRSKNTTPSVSPRASKQSLSEKVVPCKYFVITLDSIGELKRSQKDGNLSVTDKVKSIISRSGADVRVFLAVSGVGQLQACAQLISNAEGRGLKVKWLKVSPLTFPINQSAWLSKSHVVCERLQEVEEKFGLSLLQAWEQQQMPGPSTHFGATRNMNKSPAYQLQQGYR